MNLTAIPQFARNVNRMREIATILSKYGLADWISRLDLDFAKGLFKCPEGRGLGELTHEMRIRLTLSALGTTFIKLGQMLSTRADLVGPALAQELTRLQADAPADPPHLVRAIVESELGQPISELFTEFDDRPIASASIAQVHRARLKGGKQVVLKVQHHGIEAKVRTDLDILVAMADLAEKHIVEVRPYRPRETAAEFQRVLLRELDFGREERNLQQFATNFANDPGVRFPSPYGELSTGKVLTMELLNGIKLSETERLKAAGLNLDQLARRGAEIFLEMIFRDGFYHGDPHPGNLLILPDGVIGMLDCGMVGRLDEGMREDIEDLLMAIAERDAVQLTNIITRIGSVPPDFDKAGLSSDVTDFLAYYANRPLNQLDLGAALTEMTDIIRRYHILLPTSIALLLKVLVMLEGTGRLLSPSFCLTEILQPYQKRLLFRRLSPARYFQKLRRLYLEWEHLAEVFPRHLTGLLQQMQSGRFDVQLEHKRLEPAINRLVFGIMTSALFMGSALLWSFKVPPTIGEVSVPGALGSGISFILGMRLLWAIRQGGHLE
jgi:ubiquinone biosynthesis protein